LSFREALLGVLRGFSSSMTGSVVFLAAAIFSFSVLFEGSKGSSGISDESSLSPFL